MATTTITVKHTYTYAASKQYITKHQQKRNTTNMNEKVFISNYTRLLWLWQWLLLLMLLNGGVLVLLAIFDCLYASFLFLPAYKTVRLAVVSASFCWFFWFSCPAILGTTAATAATNSQSIYQHTHDFVYSYTANMSLSHSAKTLVHSFIHCIVQSVSLLLLLL